MQSVLVFLASSDHSACSRRAPVLAALRCPSRLSGLLPSYRRRRRASGCGSGLGLISIAGVGSGPTMECRDSPRILRSACVAFAGCEAGRRLETTGKRAAHSRGQREPQTSSATLDATTGSPTRALRTAQGAVHALPLVLVRIQADPSASYCWPTAAKSDGSCEGGLYPPLTGYFSMHARRDLP